MMVTVERARPAYSVVAMRRACEHYASGWKPVDIQRLLDEEGHGRPSINTIYQWVNAEYRERHRRGTRQRHARRAAQAASFRLSSDTEEYRQAFILRLREQGLQPAAIGKVCGVVFGEELSRHQVAYRLSQVEAA